MRTSRSRSSPPSCSHPGSSSSSAPGKATRTARSPRPSPRSASPTRCFAVDTWEGDDHTGRYGEAVLEELRQHHDPLYAASRPCSRCPSMTLWPDSRMAASTCSTSTGTTPTKPSAHDFEAWLPKLGTRGVALLHDTEERGSDFGVWRFSAELTSRSPPSRFLTATASVWSLSARRWTSDSSPSWPKPRRIPLSRTCSRRWESSASPGRAAAPSRGRAGLRAGEPGGREQELSASRHELVDARAGRELEHRALARLEAEREGGVRVPSWRLTSPLRAAGI